MEAARRGDDRQHQEGLMNNELFVFVHIPKTGGQTLRNHFITHLVFHEEFIHLGPYGMADAQQRGLLPFEERPLVQRQRARVLLGHYVTHQSHTLVEGKTPLHVTFLREPAEMLVSYYNFEMEQRRKNGQPIDPFEQWYAGKRNMMTSWLHTHFMGRNWSEVTDSVLNEVLETLDRFWFVGVTEHMTDDAPWLLERIGTVTRIEPANVAGVHYPRTLSLSPDLREWLNADNLFDVQLHEYGRGRRLKTIGSQSPEKSERTVHSSR
jgi:hypothetical protein